MTYYTVDWYTFDTGITAGLIVFIIVIVLFRIIFKVLRG